MNREELRKQLERIRWECATRVFTGEGRDTFDEISDFIIADRLRIVGPLIKLGDISGQPLPTYEELCYAIEITLKMAGYPLKEQGGNNEIHR